MMSGCSSAWHRVCRAPQGGVGFSPAQINECRFAPETVRITEFGLQPFVLPFFAQPPKKISNYDSFGNSKRRYDLRLRRARVHVHQKRVSRKFHGLELLFCCKQERKNCPRLRRQKPPSSLFLFPHQTLLTLLKRRGFFYDS